MTEHLGDRISKKKFTYFCLSSKTLCSINLIVKKSRFDIFLSQNAGEQVRSKLQNATKNHDLRTHIALPIKLSNKQF